MTHSLGYYCVCAQCANYAAQQRREREEAAQRQKAAEDYAADVALRGWHDFDG
jgi:hypothetical protein